MFQLRLLLTMWSVMKPIPEFSLVPIRDLRKILNVLCSLITALRYTNVRKKGAPCNILKTRQSSHLLSSPTRNGYKNQEKMEDTKKCYHFLLFLQNITNRTKRHFRFSLYFHEHTNVKGD